MRDEALNHVQLAMPPGGEDAARRFYAGILGRSLSELILEYQYMKSVRSPDAGCWPKQGENDRCFLWLFF